MLGTKVVKIALFLVAANVLTICSAVYGQECSVDAPADPMTGAEHTIPDHFLPMVGATVLVGTTPLDQTQGQVRVVVFSVFPKPLTKLVNRTYVPPTSHGLNGTWVIGLSTPGGPPPRMPQDGFSLIGAYLPQNQFKYRLELCDGGKWVTITTPETSHTFAYSQKYQDDVYTVTYGSRQDHPTANGLLTSVVFTMKPKLIDVHVDWSLGCRGIPGVVAHSSDTVHGYITDHYTGQPVIAQNIGVSMIFDGNTNIVPQPGHGSINYPGSGDPFNPGQGYVDKFPYSQVSKSGSDTSTVTLDDQSFGILVGGPCRPYNGVVRVIMYDGQVITAVHHTE